MFTLSYSSTDRTSPFMSALPPVGVARTSPQTLHTILLTALLKISCSLPHFWHFTRRKTLLGLGISLFQSDMVFQSPIVCSFFLGEYHLCGTCSCMSCTLNAKFVFLWSLRMCVVRRIFVHRNLLFHVRGLFRLLRALGVCRLCRGIQCE
jgi:hypothetical protein